MRLALLSITLCALATAVAVATDPVVLSPALTSTRVQLNGPGHVVNFTVRFQAAVPRIFLQFVKSPISAAGTFSLAFSRGSPTAAPVWSQAGGSLFFYKSPGARIGGTDSNIPLITAGIANDTAATWWIAAEATQAMGVEAGFSSGCPAVRPPAVSACHAATYAYDPNGRYNMSTLADTAYLRGNQACAGYAAYTCSDSLRSCAGLPGDAVTSWKPCRYLCDSVSRDCPVFAGRTDASWQSWLDYCRADAQTTAWAAGVSCTDMRSPDGLGTEALSRTPVTSLNPAGASAATSGAASCGGSVFVRPAHLVPGLLLLAAGLSVAL